MVIDDNCEDTVYVLPDGSSIPSQECTVEPTDVFIALFAIFFGASQAGTAMSMGPDFAKA